MKSHNSAQKDSKKMCFFLVLRERKKKGKKGKRRERKRRKGRKKRRGKREKKEKRKKKGRETRRRRRRRKGGKENQRKKITEKKRWGHECRMSPLWCDGPCSQWNMVDGGVCVCVEWMCGVGVGIM
jgi:hypothetical protein